MRSLIVIIWLFSQSVSASSYNGFDVTNSLIDKVNIVQGGPLRDSIPAISEPNYVAATEAVFIQDNDTVLGLLIKGQALAYPRHILNWHEIINDQIDNEPFVITYCPLCGSGMAFSAKLDDQRLQFGVSGLLYNNDLLFYDRGSESLWSQIERRAISGAFAGQALQQLKLEHTSWKAWLNKHPKTKVLSEQQGYKRQYRHDPYTGYDTSSQVFFKTLRDAPKEFHSKEKVLGIIIGDESKAYPFSELSKYQAASIEDQLANVRYRVLWDANAQSATIESIGSEVLTPTVLFWFAWYNFHPQTQIFRAIDANEKQADSDSSKSN